MATWVKVNNAWRLVQPTSASQWVKVNGHFRQVIDRRDKVNGVWRNAN